MINSDLSEDAKAHLILISGGADLSRLEAVEVDTLFRYCESCARWAEAERQITEHGLLVKGQSGFPGETPYIGIAARYSGLCSKMEAGVKKILIELRRDVHHRNIKDAHEEAAGETMSDLDSVLGAGLRVVEPEAP